SQAKLLVRAFDRTDAIELIHAGVADPVRETFDSGLRMGRLALAAQGIEGEEADAVVDDVRRRDEKRLALQVEEIAGTDVGTLEAMKKIKPEPVGPAG
ncbi:MAG: potassium transporter, partial [Alphaproteobacteria bacterium]|nr:potassium transporter [Alphaproteobacteria bacterium]